MKVLKRHISVFEKATAVIFWVMLLLTIITQVFFDGDVLLLMALFAVLAVVFSLMVFLPETYEFREETLSVVNPKLKRVVHIPYDRIVKIDTVGLFRQLKKDFDSTEVILTFKPVGGERKRTISCHPKNVLGFMRMLHEKCPHLMEAQGDE